MTKHSAICGEFLKKLSDLSSHLPENEIKSTTEIFYDLKISGDDFDELLEWMVTKYNVDFSRMNGRYVPGEAEIFPLFFRIFGARPYMSITVGDMLSAIKREHW